MSVQKEIEEWTQAVYNDGLREGVVVRCPCGQLAALGFQGEAPAALHKVPCCTDFMSRSPEQYATYIRQEFTRKMGGDVGV